MGDYLSYFYISDLSLRVYINGDLDKTDSDGPSYNCCARYSNNNMLFGARYTNELDTNLGTRTMDELLIYDKVLSASEVKGMYGQTTAESGKLKRMFIYCQIDQDML